MAEEALQMFQFLPVRLSKAILLTPQLSRRHPLKFQFLSVRLSKSIQTTKRANWERQDTTFQFLPVRLSKSIRHGGHLSMRGARSVSIPSDATNQIDHRRTIQSNQSKQVRRFP